MASDGSHWRRREKKWGSASATQSFGSNVALFDSPLCYRPKSLFAGLRGTSASAAHGQRFRRTVVRHRRVSSRRRSPAVSNFTLIFLIFFGALQGPCLILMAAASFQSRNMSSEGQQSGNICSLYGLYCPAVNCLHHFSLVYLVQHPAASQPLSAHICDCGSRRTGAHGLHARPIGHGNTGAATRCQQHRSQLGRALSTILSNPASSCGRPS